MEKLALLICLLLMQSLVRADASATQPADAAKPFENDGLRVTVTLAKATIAAGEPLKFTVQFKNISDKPFQLFNADGYHYHDWRFRFMKHGLEEGGWGEFIFNQAGSLKSTVVQLDVGKTLDVPAVIEGMDLSSVARILSGGKQEKLGPGKFQLVVRIDLENNATNDPNPAIRYWAGQIFTEAAEFEIAN